MNNKVFIENELFEVRKICERAIPGTKLVSCLETMVRVQIRSTNLRTIIACLRFPDNYPDSPILIELKSRTLSGSFLLKLQSIADNEIQSIKTKPQVIAVLKFVKKFLDENPLIVCYDEITAIKKILETKDELKLKQKQSLILLKIIEEQYYLQVKIRIPENYIEKPIEIEQLETNLPAVFERFLVGQSQAIARQCSEPPSTRLVTFKGEKQRIVGGKVVKASTVSNEPFKPSPSLKKVVAFLFEAFHQLLSGKCQLCKLQCLPPDPEKIQRDESADDHVERIYCGHLFHLQCLMTYMKTPPFQGGKKCPSCGEVVAHDKWRLSERLAEDRWAHQQARDRELNEIAEFFE